jgi:cAMP phosphodiesterase
MDFDIDLEFSVSFFLQRNGHQSSYITRYKNSFIVQYGFFILLQYISAFIVTTANLDHVIVIRVRSYYLIENLR